MSLFPIRPKARCYFQPFRCTFLIALLYLIPSALSGDTIQLKSGQTITGTWIGANNREVRIAVGDRVQTIPISDIERVDFGSSARASSSPVASPRPNPEPAVPAKPDIDNKQAKFCEVIGAYRADVMRIANEPNPIVRAGLRKPEPANYDVRVIALLGTSGEFDSWHGTVSFHVSGQWVVLQFTPDCKPPQGVAFSTADAPQARDFDQTLIPLNSPIARTLSRIKPGDPVLVSGHLFYAGGKPAYRGSPDNPNASVASPHYLGQFSAVMPRTRK